MYKKGLEIASIAAIDVAQHTAYHVEAVQSPSARRDRIDESTTLIDHYADIIVQRSEQLHKISDTIVFDAYFTKRKFVDKVCDQAGFEMIGRLRDDADLCYLFKGQQSAGRGRPRKYAGKIDVKNIDKRRIPKVYEDKECKIYEAVVYSKGLKRKIKLAYVEHTTNGKMIIKLYFSTDLERLAVKVLKYYRLRYQMEYIFRDAKQQVGLAHCQARSKNKLHFHFNASLTAVSIAKIIARNKLKNNQRMPVSIADVKMEFQNRNLIQRIFSIYGLSPKLIKINKQYRQLLNFGKIAA